MDGAGGTARNEPITTNEQRGMEEGAREGWGGGAPEEGTFRLMPGRGEVSCFYIESPHTTDRRGGGE